MSAPAVCGVLARQLTTLRGEKSKEPANSCRKKVLPTGEVGLVEVPIFAAAAAPIAGHGAAGTRRFSWVD